MVHAICTKKVRDSRGNIKSYVLQDIRGYCVEMTPADLKRSITVNSVNVLNLQIDKAGRLVDKAMPKLDTPVKKTPAPAAKNKVPSFSDQEIENFIDHMVHRGCSFIRECTEDLYDKQAEYNVRKYKVAYNCGFLSYDSDGYPLFTIKDNMKEKYPRSSTDVFNTLVRQIVDYAENHTITGINYSVDFFPDFPKNIMNIIQKIDGTYKRGELGWQLFRVAGESPRIAYIQWIEADTERLGFTSYSILTNSYDEAKRYFQECEYLKSRIKEIKEEVKNGMQLDEQAGLLLGDRTVRERNNAKGNMFYAKYLAEQFGFDEEYFLKKTLKIMINDYKNYKCRTKKESIVHCLESGSMYINYYLALRNKVFQDCLGDNSKIDDRFYNQIIEDEANNILTKYGHLFNR